jgi:hypothetical protein
MSQGALRQDELIGDKPPVVKYLSLLQVSRQPARTEAFEHGRSKVNLHCQKPLPDNRHVNTYRGSRSLAMASENKVRR